MLRRTTATDHLHRFPHGLTTRAGVCLALLLAAVGSPASAAGQQQRGVDAGPVAPSAERLAAAHRNDAPNQVFSRQDTRALLRAAWRSYGYEGADLSYRVRANLRQIERESGRRVGARSPMDSNAGSGFQARGLLQMIDPVFRRWSVAGHRDARNPLDQILASVNMQVNDPGLLGADENGVLDGRGAWTP